MKNVLIPLLPEYSIQIPQEPLALLVWFIWCGLIIFLAIKLRDRWERIDRQKLFWMAFLSVLILVLTPFFGINPGSEGAISASYPPIRHLMFFAAVPWMVAGGMVGLLPAVGLAGMSGLLLAYLDTHNIFTPLILMSLALLYSWGIRQRYRTLFFRLLRFPVFGGLISLVVCVGLLFSASLLSVPGEVVLKIVVSATRMPKMIFSLAGMVLIGGIIATFMGVLFENLWGGEGPLETAPGEKSLIFRILAITLPLFALIWSGVAIGFWAASEKSTRKEMVTQLIHSADSASQGVSTFVNTGEVLLAEIANAQQLTTVSGGDFQILMAQQTAAISFFDQLGLFDRNGALLTRFSNNSIESLSSAPSAEVVTDLFSGDDVASLQILPTISDNQAIYLEFLYGISDATGQITRLLWGQTTVESNPINQGWITALSSLREKGGLIQILNETGSHLYHSDPGLGLRATQGSQFKTPTFYEGMNQTGSPSFHYYQPIPNTDWAVLTSIPSIVIQEITWQKTTPVLIATTGSMILILLVAMLALWPLFLDIQQINRLTSQVSSGNYVVQLGGSKTKAEMGQMMGLVGRMVASLRKQLIDQETLFLTNQKLEEHRSVDDVIQTLLQTALTQNVSSVRVALQDPLARSPKIKITDQFGLGEYAQDLASFDDIILEKLQNSESLVLVNVQVGQQLQFAKEIPLPTAVMAYPLKWEDQIFGAFWVTRHDGQYPDQSELRFFEQLAQIAAGTIKNAQIFQDYNLQQAQLKSILDSVPDAVLISNPSGQVIYSNKRAKTLLGHSIANKQLRDLFEDQNLVELLEWGREGFHSKEIQTNEGKFYHVVTQPIELSANEKGQATLITEMTDQRMRESRKSEFVTTASHELRSPLTLIHGYAKILRLTGDLNEQQDGYVSKIISSVEEMTSLVQNLLDMGRLESETSLVISQITAQELVQKIVSSMDVQAKQKNITLRKAFPEAPIIFHGDATLLSQALRNLVDNAIKFTKMGGQVTLSAQTNQGNLIFAVKDTGTGIAPLDQRHIFEKFKTISPDMGADKRGSGLGLAIVKSIAERHQGRVWFETQLGKGSTFFLQIPIK